MKAIVVIVWSHGLIFQLFNNVDILEISLCDLDNEDHMVQTIYALN